jgi:hypothetical protein
MSLLHEISEADLKALLDRIRELRDLTYAHIGLDVQTAPGLPATPKQIAELETSTGIRLPPDYRSFLLIHNGWQYWSGDVALLSTDQMLSGKYAERIAEWKTAEANRWNREVAGALVIGFSLYVGEKILLFAGAEGTPVQVVTWDTRKLETFRGFFMYLLNQKGILEEELLAEPE